MNAKKLLVAAFLFWTTGASAAIWTDLWWNPTQSGWGVTITQQNNIVFLTFFVYASDGSAKWYTATAYRGAKPPSGYASYSGDMYETRGPWFGSSFNPSFVTARKVGTTTFSPLTPGTANLSYTVDGIPVSKSIERQTFRHINLGGDYYGAYRVGESNCAGITIGDYGTVSLVLSATVNSDGATGTLNSMITFDGNSSCTNSGSYRQYGSIFYVKNATACGSSLGSLEFSDLGPTDEGIEGNITIYGSSGCRAGLSISAVRLY